MLFRLPEYIYRKKIIYMAGRGKGKGRNERLKTSSKILKREN
jgi:hypothetical protein